MKNLIALLSLCLTCSVNAQESGKPSPSVSTIPPPPQTYKSLNNSIGVHYQSPNSFGIYGTWETNDYKYLYADLSFTLGRYTYYDNISYYTALNVYGDQQLGDYPDAISMNIGYVFNDDVDHIRPFVYAGINGGTRHVGFRDETRILSSSGNYAVSLPNSGFTKINIGAGAMIPLKGSQEIKISIDANPPAVHVGYGLVRWSKSKR